MWNFYFQHTELTVRRLVVARVPLMVSTVLVWLPLHAVFQNDPMLSNLFSLRSQWEFGVVIFLGLLASWQCGAYILLMWRLADKRLYGGKRAARNAPQLCRDSVPGQRSKFIGFADVLPFTLLAVPLIGVSWGRSEFSGGQFTAFFSGTLTALLLLSLVGLQRFTVRGQFGWFKRILSGLPESLVAGYVVRKNRDLVLIYPGHGTFFAIFLTLALIYVLGQRWFHPSEVHPWQIPALAYGLLLLMLIDSFASGVSFFLDRFRIPIFALLLVWMSVISLARYIVPLQCDHTFSVTELPAAELGAKSQERSRLCLPTPGDSLAMWLDGEEQRLRKNGYGGARPSVVVVCASGGGIQAAVWTTCVLTWLQEDPALGPRFTRAIRFISSTSGGSLGVVYFIEGFDQDDHVPLTENLARIREASMRSSIAETSWGILYPDLQRVFAPFLVNSGHDRAWAMECAWSRALKIEGRRKIDSHFSDWARRAMRSELPGVTFNSFLVETGERVLFNTVSIPTTRGARTFCNLYGHPDAPTDSLDVDIGVLTAARLSATFPYVTPIARARWDEDHAGEYELPTAHLGDGGYFDNSGIVTAIEWIQALLDDPTTDRYGRTYADRIGQIVVVELRAFSRRFGETLESQPTVIQQASGRRSSNNERRGGAIEQSPRGWLYSAVGPGKALLNTLQVSQVARGETELLLLMEKHHGRIQHVVFQPQIAGGPLSWHLDRHEIDRILAQRTHLLGSSQRPSRIRNRLLELMSPVQHRRAHVADKHSVGSAAGKSGTHR